MKTFITTLILLYGELIYAQTIEVPVIDCVTINNLSKKPVIKWKINDNLLIDGFIVKRLIYSYPGVVPQTYNTVAVINNNSTFEYEDISTIYGEALPYQRIEEYRIVAFKNDVGNILYSLMSNPHKTIFLQADYDYCKRQIFLKWNKYNAWNDNIKEYRIYNKENGLFTQIATINANDSIYNQNIVLDRNYEIFVEAVRNDGIVSESNIINLYADSPIFPDKLNVDSVSFINNNLEINFSFDSNTDINKYILYRKENASNIYDSIFTINTVLNNNISYIDTNIDIEKEYQYFVSGIDYCGKAVINSDTVSNCVLESITPELNQRVNNLYWNKISNYAQYKIFRKYGDKEYELIANINDTFYVDNINNIYLNEFDNAKTSGIFNYKIVSFTDKYKVLSNEEGIYQTEAVFLPNAFNPKSNIEKNKTFKPVIAFVSDYILVVYDYNGNVVFETKNPNKGWGGRLPNGEFAKQGTYIFYLKYKTSAGLIKTIKNYVNLIIQD